MSLHVEHHGTDGAPAVVLLHGLGVSSWMWNDVTAELSHDHRCITVDLPGNGRSADVPWVSLDTAATAVVAATATLAGGPVHVVGLSLGGYVALRMLANHPDAIATAIVSGITLRPLTPRGLWRTLTWMGAPVLRSRPAAQLSARALQLPDESRPLYINDLRTLTNRTIRRVYAEVIDFVPPAQLVTRTQPLLAVAGGLEVTAVRTGLNDIIGAAPNATAAIAPGLQHGWAGQDPALFAAMVRARVAGDPLPPGLDQITAAA